MSKTNHLYNPWSILSGVIFLISLMIGLSQTTVGGISAVTWQLIGLFLSCLILWLKVAIDWPSILCLIGLGLLPGLTYSDVFQLSFGNTTFVFLFFTFIVTYALEQTLALKRVIAWALNSQWAAASPNRFIFSFLSVMLLLASFISPTILFMIAFPLYEEIMHQFGIKKNDRRASIILIALFSTLAIGTAMTPINHVFAITAMGIYSSATDTIISNGDYMAFAVPTGLIVFLGLLFSLRFIWKVDFSKVKAHQLSSLKNLKSMDPKEKWTVGVFIFMIAMWLLPEMLGGLVPSFSAFFKQAGIAFPPMVATLLLATIHVGCKPIIKLPTAISEGVYWPSLLIVAATLSLGSALANPDFGVTALIENQLTPFLSVLPAILIVAFFIIWSGLQTNFASNLVTTTMVTTIMTTIISSQPDLAVNGAVLACLIGFMASLALMTPPAMPYVAISIGSEWTTARDCLVYGLWIMTIATLTVTLIGYPLGNMII